MNFNIQNIIKNKRGFSLLEILFTISIVVMAGFLVADFVIQGFQATLFGQEQNMATQNARKVSRLVVNELREATQSEGGDYSLDTVLPQTLIFYSDIDKDNSIEKVRYFLDGSILKRGVINPSSGLYPAEDEVITDEIEYMNNKLEPVFTYYNKNNVLIADPTTNKTSIRLIHISLKINVTPTQEPNDIYVDMDVQLRNLKDNL